MAKQDFQVDEDLIHRSKRPTLCKNYTLEHGSSSIVMIESGNIPAISSDMHEDWQLVSSRTSSYYDMILSKINGFDKYRLREESIINLRSLKDQRDTDWEFWTAIISDFQATIRKDRTRLDQNLLKGIPPPLRGILWQVFSEVVNEKGVERRYRELMKVPSPHEKIIRRDLPRAFPNVDYFNTDDGQEKLFNVIKAYSLFDEQVGYCQGIHFIAGCLLLHMPEEAAFAVLIKLMTKYEFRTQFTPKMEKLHERMFQFDQLLELHLPQVHRHLDAQGVLPSMYASQWFMTMFVYRCPLDLVFAIFDAILVDGADIMLNIGLALIKKNQQIIVCLEFESLLDFFNGRVFDAYKDNPGSLLEDAYGFLISPRLLYKLSKQYTAEAAHQEKLQCIEDDVKRKNIELDENLKKLKESYKSLNAEYQRVSEELIEAKMSIVTIDEQNQQLKQQLFLTNSKISIAENSGYKDQIIRLSESNARLANENSNLQDRLSELESLTIDLKMNTKKVIVKEPLVLK